MTRTARALLTLLVGALAACTPVADGGRTTPAPSAGPVTPSPGGPPPTAAAPTPGSVRADGVAVTADGVVVLHALAVGPDAVATVHPDGDLSVVTVDAGASGAPAEVLLAAPVGAALSVQDDGSFLVLAADGTFLAGAARPVTPTPITSAGGAGTAGEGGARGPVRISADGDLLRAAVDADGGGGGGGGGGGDDGGSGGGIEVRVSGSALSGADWGEREGGRSLAVAPTPWARSAGQAGEAAVWAELVADVPEADTQVMRDQLTCHVIGAPDKETWNLEPWRPDVGLLRVLADACNPT